MVELDANCERRACFVGLYLCAILSDGMTVVLFIFLEDGEHCRICLGKKGVITTYK